MTTSYFLTAVAISAVITFGLRALPFLAFSGSRKMPASLERLGQALPSAIMAVLIIYCMKDIPSGGISAAVPKLLAAAVVFITYKWKHQTLISILLGTISYMVLLHLF
ncbi:MAG: branched-chain amino acid transporter permease [Blautia sp.]